MKPFTLALSIIAGLLVAMVALAVGTSAALAAVSLESYKAGLERAGFQVTVDPNPVDHAALEVDATLITAEKGRASVRLELIVYDSRASLKEDWSAVDGQSPTPETATTDFDGRVLYWNDNAILAVSFAPPNDPGLAQIAGNVFLGRVGIGGPGITLPSTGDGGYLPQDETAGGFGVLAAALMLAVLGLACGGVLASRFARSS